VGGVALFDLWDVETGNLIATFASEAEALETIRQLMELNGGGYADALDLGRIDDDGNSRSVATGQALADRAHGSGRSEVVPYAG
jgi:hypothetical protein